jgi:hypothetical protein
MRRQYSVAIENGSATVGFLYRWPLAGAFDFCVRQRKFKTKFKNAGRRPAVQKACAPSQQCTHSAGVLLASSGTACRAPTAENATTKIAAG